MAKPSRQAVQKVSVQCPHCGAEQMESKLAKSTICRACNQYFTVGAARSPQPKTPSAPPRPSRPASAAPRDSVAPPVSADPATAASVQSSPAPAPAEKKEGGGWWNKLVSAVMPESGPKVVTCFECGARQEVPRTASSCSCRSCGAYLDLQDFKIIGAFSRSVRTAGNIYVTAKGDMNSTRAVCGSAEVRGILRGNLTCLGEMRIKYKGKLPGGIETRILHILKGSDLDFFRPIHAAEVIVDGDMKGRILSTGTVTITKTGSITGALFARAISIERGGEFHGDMIIGQQPEHQTELIPNKKKPPEAGRTDPQTELGFGFS